MKIYKIKSKKKDDDFYDLPMCLTNRDMFSYPILRNNDEYDMIMKKRINAIVTMFGEKYNIMNIGMMGYDHMIIFTWDNMEGDNQIEHDIYFGYYMLYNNILFELENYNNDYIKAIRYIKINKLIKT